MVLVSFVCQQACLFFSEGVRFSGLLNQTGRFVPGSQPDARILAEEEDRKRLKNSGAGGKTGSGGDALLLAVHLLCLWAYRQPCFGLHKVSTHQWMCRDLSLPLTPSLTGNDVV